MGQGLAVMRREVIRWGESGQGFVTYFEVGHVGRKEVEQSGPRCSVW